MLRSMFADYVQRFARLEDVEENQEAMDNSNEEGNGAEENDGDELLGESDQDEPDMDL